MSNFFSTLFKNEFEVPKNHKRPIRFDRLLSNLRTYLFNKKEKVLLSVFGSNGEYWAVKDLHVTEDNKDSFIPEDTKQNVILEMSKTIDNSIYLKCYNKPHVYKQDDVQPFYAEILTADQFHFLVELLQEYIKKVETKETDPVDYERLNDCINDLLNIEKEEKKLFFDSNPLV